MLTKEYRIPMPLSVDEYKIAQLYMIAKKSKKESQGAESGVEILQNEPYHDGPGGSGQYTYKIYHVGQHLPAWMKSLLPKSALTVEEMAWNSYPYTKTRYTCPFVEKFSIEIETRYFDDCGNQDNVFNLPNSELDRPIDVIDIVRETLAYNEGIKEEDLKLYTSQKTRRGPLPEDWLKRYWNDGKPNQSVMCAYKLCKVEFKYWGMQNKIEKFIHDMALRKTMLTAHQQAWVWQDEWVDMTMEDIRLLEIETQEYLKRRMELHLSSQERLSTLNINQNSNSGERADAQENQDAHRRSFNDDKTKIRSDSRSALHSPAEALDVISTWRLKSLVTESDSDSDQTFYDAEDIEEETADKFPQDSRYRLPHQSSDLTDFEDDASSVSKISLSQKTFDDDTCYGAMSSVCSVSNLIIIFHGGSLIDSGQDPSDSEENDVKTFKKTMDFVIEQHYTHLSHKIAIRSVQCHEFCGETRKILSNLSTDASKSNFDSIPIGALPICAISSPDYREYCAKLVANANSVYQEFIHSSEGRGFMGKVCFIADSIGAIAVFDALCQQHPQPPPSTYRTDSFGSQSSLRSNSPSPGQDFGLRTESPKSRTLPANNWNSGGVLNSTEIRQSSRLYSKSVSHPGDGCSKQLFGADKVQQISRISSDSCNSQDDLQSLDFEVNDFFMFGSLVGIVLTFRKILNPLNYLVKPQCQNIYNLFHSSEPSALRIEPLLLPSRFSQVPPVPIPRHTEYPLGDGGAVTLAEYLPLETAFDADSVMQSWWGSKRIDYQIYCPNGLANFPTQSLPLIFHASYWESNDVIAFILRQFNRFEPFSRLANHYQSSSSALSQRSYSFKPRQPREKWLKKRTAVKIRNVAANHRANDVIVREGLEQTIHGRFVYGPLDLIALNGENIDVHIKGSKDGDWVFLDTVTTDKSGRMSYTVPDDKMLACGLYKFKLLVRGDHTYLDLFMAVIPPQTEAVVFSIDGSLTASFSVSGRDPKIRPGAIDVVRFWQERGYLIIYISARPDIQQSRVVSWMSQHNFPHGLVYFVDRFTTDPIGYKADYLKSLREKMNVTFAAGYGSSKDVHMYEALGLPSSRICIVGKVAKKLQPSVHSLNDGYMEHLRDLHFKNGYSPKFQANPRAVLPKGSFSHKRTANTPKNIT